MIGWLFDFPFLAPVGLHHAPCAVCSLLYLLHLLQLLYLLKFSSCVVDHESDSSSLLNEYNYLYRIGFPRRRDEHVASPRTTKEGQSPGK